jgi:hypothetical protein
LAEVHSRAAMAVQARSRGHGRIPATAAAHLPRWRVRAKTRTKEARLTAISTVSERMATSGSG